MMENVPKSIKSRKLITFPLFHISFKGDLEGLWTPGTQAGSDVPGEHEDSSWAYPEPAMEAISLGPDIERCFRGIYPNVAKFFEKDKLPHINLFVYRPLFVGDERIVPPDILVRDKWVWDAYATQEYRCLDPLQMNLVGEVQIINTNSSPTMMAHPFNDPKNPKEEMGPTTIRYKWVFTNSFMV
jgi:hypothetical protein